MTKTLAALLIAVAIGLSSKAPAADGPRDLWIGVLGFREPYGSLGPKGMTGIDLSIVLQPVAALVGDKWWFESPNDFVVNDALRDAQGKVPAEWLPRRTVLPSSWQAHVFDGRRVTLRASGALQARGDHPYASQLVVKTNLKPPRVKEGNAGGDAQGVAVAGDLRTRLFADLPVSGRAELLNFFTVDMLAAERAEIQRQAAGAKRIDGAFPNDADTKLMMSLLASTPFKSNVARTATQSGAPIYVIEGSKVLLSTREFAAVMHTGAAARRDRAGGLHLLGAWSYLDTNEWAYEGRPLAVLEREGDSCWLIAWQVEGGYEYSLTRPGQMGLDGFSFPFACDIK